MRFLSQHLRSGELQVTDGPIPSPHPRGIVVQTHASLVSAGTERMLVDFGRGSLVSKARQQPHRVREVLDRAKAEGVVETYEAVRSKLEQPLVLGYANAGVVVAVGAHAAGFVEGDLVASNGPHAEFVSVPVTLAAKAPADVSPDHACFASVAAVGLEGIRLAHAELGEQFVVTGLGLIGLLTVQLLQAHGCRVLGIDPDPARRELAASFGATAVAPEAAVETAQELSAGRGIDGVLVCASTSSSDPMLAAAQMCRDRGRIVLVGVTGLDLDRTVLYEKELTVKVSRSYGPGRYDETFESGTDYPFGLVRWTAGRNMQAVLDLVARGALDLEPLVTHRFAFDDAATAYDTLVSDSTSLGIVLTYDRAEQAPPAPALAVPAPRAARPTDGRLALIGAGNFASRTLAPAILSAGGTIGVVASRTGTDAALLAGRLEATSSADPEAVLSDATVGAAFIATRHDSHARLATTALRSGTAAYIEKPLALTEDELDELAGVLTELGADAPVLMVGFNRRFAPVTARMRELLSTVPGPKAVVITVNAGSVPLTHWVHDPSVGGGRILGEGCHFIDLARHLVSAPIATSATTWLGRQTARDSAAVQLSFEDGSVATVHYLANGSKRFPKERIEVFADGRVLRNDNFRRLEVFGWSRRHAMRLRRQDKGHVEAVRAFLSAVRHGGVPPIPLDELFEVSRAAIRAAG